MSCGLFPEVIEIMSVAPEASIETRFNRSAFQDEECNAERMLLGSWPLTGPFLA